MVRMLADNGLFIAASGAYAGMRLVLYAMGQGRLMYGSNQFAILQHAVDVATGYVVLGLGFWWEPKNVYGWPLWVKLSILAVTLVVVVLLARWVGKAVVFGAGWFVITLLLTLQAVALRWFYLPALGVGIVVAAVWMKLRDEESTRGGASWKRALSFVPLLMVVWFGWQTVRQNQQWVDSGEVARGLLAQVKALHPDPALPATFYVANPPYFYKDVLLFNTGMDSAMSHVYNDWDSVTAYSLDEDHAQVDAALADPAKVGPNPVFLRYENGKMVNYPSLRALAEAGK
jgi:hypothetical protein